MLSFFSAPCEALTVGCLASLTKGTALLRSSLHLLLKSARADFRAAVAPIPWRRRWYARKEPQAGFSRLSLRVCRRLCHAVQGDGGSGGQAGPLTIGETRARRRLRRLHLEPR
ncbi:hypothetical protein ATO13_05170 [Stappia sp. 22II-S9-Z10]|nr:hypothetical protein ATO13_05170 [Stappia sp. 22II-S9-Z10]